MNQKVVPFTNKVTRNPWVKAVQDSFLTILPFVLVGSFVTLIGLVPEIPWVRENWTWWPDLSPISSFSFGLMGLILAFLIPYFAMENKGVQRTKLLAGATGIASYLMLAKPALVVDEETWAMSATFEFDRFGAGGVFVALVVGLLVGLIFFSSSKWSFFKKSSSLPDFIITWFDSLIPIAVVLGVSWLITFSFGFDAFAILGTIFSPLLSIGQSYPGFVLIVFITVFIYSFGISSWVMGPIIFPIMFAGIAENQAAVAAGLAPTMINTQEVVYIGWIAIGGLGATLPLALMMLFAAKSKQLKAVGKAVIVPSIFNINEPVVFGAPIAFNPILMIPMWINGLLLPLIVWPALHFGMAPIPAEPFQIWYMPYPISTWLVAPAIGSLILFVIVVAVATAVWFPFFRVYDNQLLVREGKTDEQQMESVGASETPGTNRPAPRKAPTKRTRVEL
ncbi:PTS transporter subunit EIIC [Actinomycetaceae bacterium MB13-C1-2]|nr:PTS transporter subunit EIIC [Actinomycetaceae bacterium MB13-C1-2]